MKMICFRVFWIHLFFLLFPYGAAHAAVDIQTLPLGQLGLGEQRVIFANAIKESFMLIQGDSNMAVSLDSQGWVRSWPQGAEAFWYSVDWPDALGGQTDEKFHGVWVLTWEGDGEIVLNGSSRKQEILLNDPLNRRMVVRLLPGEAALVEIRAITSGNHLRNIKLWPPAYPGGGAGLTTASPLGPGEVTDNLEPAPGEPEPVFHPLRLEHLRQADHGVLRFMDWLHINGEDEIIAGAWDSRRPYDYATQGEVTLWDPQNQTNNPIPGYKSNSGIAYEYLIDLCNELDRDLWIQTPHDASVDYVRRLAQLVAGADGHPGLEAGLRVWIELSNEIWNPVLYYMQQVNYAREVAAAHFGVHLEDVEPLGAMHGWGSGHIQGEFLRDFAQEWADLGMPRNRLVAVAAGFLHGVQPYNEAVIDAVQEVAPDMPDVFAVTHYFGSVADQLYELGYDENGDASEELYEQAFRVMADNLMQATIPDAERNVALCVSKGGIPVVAYEGGQHLVAPVWLMDQADFVAFLNNINRHPLMAEAYRLMYSGWTAAGAMTSSQFVDMSSPAPWGSWGAKEFIRQSIAEAPKWQAFIEWSELQQGVRALGYPIGSAPVVTTPDPLPGAEAGKPYSVTITASGGDGQLRFAMLNSLPQGLSLSVHNGEARISGLPGKTGRFLLALRVLDADNDPGYRIFSLHVEARNTARNTLLHFRGEDVVLPEGEEHMNSRRTVVTQGNATSMPFSMADGYHLFPLDRRSNLNLYGGLRVATSGNGETSLWPRLDDGSPGVFAVQAGAAGESPWTFDALLVWRKEQFQKDGDVSPVAFGMDASTATMRMHFQSLGPDTAEVRFAVLDGAQWYLSEAAYTRSAAGVFEISDFNDNPAPGRRWAAFAPTSTDFGIPENLSFAAHDFSDVRAVGVAYRGERYGWHWDMTFDEFLVLANMAPRTGGLPAVDLLLKR